MEIASVALCDEDSDILNCDWIIDNYSITILFFQPATAPCPITKIKIGISKKSPEKVDLGTGPSIEPEIKISPKIYFYDKDNFNCLCMSEVHVTKRKIIIDGYRL